MNILRHEILGEACCRWGQVAAFELVKVDKTGYIDGRDGHSAFNFNPKDPLWSACDEISTVWYWSCLAIIKELMLFCNGDVEQLAMTHMEGDDKMKTTKQ